MALFCLTSSSNIEYNTLQTAGFPIAFNTNNKTITIASPNNSGGETAYEFNCGCAIPTQVYLSSSDSRHYLIGYVKDGTTYVPKYDTGVFMARWIDTSNTPNTSYPYLYVGGTITTQKAITTGGFIWANNSISAAASISAGTTIYAGGHISTKANITAEGPITSKSSVRAPMIRVSTSEPGKTVLMDSYGLVVTSNTTINNSNPTIINYTTSITQNGIDITSSIGTDRLSTVVKSDNIIISDKRVITSTKNSSAGRFTYTIEVVNSLPSSPVSDTLYLII